MTTTQTLLKQLGEQLSNPQHVYVELAPGLFKRHSVAKNPEDRLPFDGKLVRMTKLAADQMCKGLRQIPCDSEEGLLLKLKET